jgi:hypothetical protein
MLYLGKRNAFAARYMTTFDSLSGLWCNSIKPVPKDKIFINVRTVHQKQY